MDDFALYGFSLFETFTAVKGTFWRLDYHWLRICRGADRFSMPAPVWSEFLARVNEAHDPTKQQVLRYTLMKVGGRWSNQKPGWQTRVLTRDLGRPPMRGAVLGTVPTRLPEFDESRCYKTGSRLVYQAALEAGRPSQWEDVVLLDMAERILETTTANIFLLLDGRWVTPPLGAGLLPGSVRDWLLERGLAEEEELFAEDLERAEAAVMTNTVHGIRPIRSINDTVYPNEPARVLIQTAGVRRFQAYRIG